MICVNADKLKALAVVFEIEASLKAHFDNFQQKYKNSFNYNLPNAVLDIVTKVNTKMLNTKASPNEADIRQRIESFAFGQLKIFSWVLAVYCYQHSLTLEALALQNFEEIQAIFPNKSLNFLRYETLCLAYEKAKYCPIWSVAELELLTSLIIKRGSFDEWRLISYQLFCQSDTKYYRPFHQCREKWFNHLDPRVKKGQWSIHEDIALLSAVECLDTKWIEIYREMGGVRTQHMIKNRYKSLLKFWKKKYEKTSAKKIVSNVLKHLKRKLKNGETENSFDEESLGATIPPKKTNKKCGRQSMQDQFVDEEKKIQAVTLDLIASEKSQQAMKSTKAQLQNQYRSAEFNLFNDIKTQQWSTTILDMQVDKEANYKNEIFRREYCFQNKLTGNGERKTSESDDPLNALPQFEDFQNASQSRRVLTVPKFDDLMMVQSDSEWIRNIQDRYNFDEQYDFFDCL